MLNTTSNNVSGITYNMVTSIIGVEHHFQQHVIYNMVTSIIGVQHHFQQCVRYSVWCITWPVLLVLNTTFNNMSCKTYNMAASFIGVEPHIQQYIRYNV